MEVPQPGSVLEKKRRQETNCTKHEARAVFSQRVEQKAKHSVSRTRTNPAVYGMRFDALTAKAVSTRGKCHGVAEYPLAQGTFQGILQIVNGCFHDS